MYLLRPIKTHGLVTGLKLSYVFNTISQRSLMRDILCLCLTWTVCWRAWSASWPPPPSHPRSCPPWGLAALPPPAPSPGWCDLWPAGTPRCRSQSRWSTGLLGCRSWIPGRPANPWWPAGPLRYRSLCTWQNDSLEEEVRGMIGGDKVLYTHCY